MNRLFTAALLSAALTLTAHAQSSKPDIKVTDAWARTTVPGQSVSGAYMHIKSNVPVKLVKAESTVAAMTEIHNMSMKDGVMSMSAVDAIEVTPGKMTDLKPGGFHIMLMQLKTPIKAGDAVPLTLTFEDAGKKTHTVTVNAKGQAKDGGSHKH